MMKNTIECYAEYLYCLSNYEKGRFAASSHFSIMKRNRLKKSIQMMSLMVCMLEGTDCSVNELNSFILRNRGKIFPIDCGFCESSNYLYFRTTNDEIITLMNGILNRILIALEKPKLQKEEKNNVAYLLRAFHNLPRAFFNSSSRLFLNRDTAIQYANDWLCRMTND